MRTARNLVLITVVSLSISSLIFPTNAHAFGYQLNWHDLQKLNQCSDSKPESIPTEFRGRFSRTQEDVNWNRGNTNLANPVRKWEVAIDETGVTSIQTSRLRPGEAPDNVYDIDSKIQDKFCIQQSYSHGLHGKMVTVRVKRLKFGFPMIISKEVSRFRIILQDNKNIELRRFDYVLAWVFPFLWGPAGGFAPGGKTILERQP